MCEENTRLQKKANQQLRSFLDECGIKNVAGKRILEIGFKNGLFVNECKQAGMIPIGTEINQEHTDKSKAKFPDLDLRWYDGNIFPVDDNSCDYVVTFQVLEHVRSHEHIFQECIRVLKPGGLMYHVCPNFHSFYEGHSRIIWLPFLNKGTGRFYLKLLRKYKPGYESLNFTKPSKMKKVLAKYSDRIEILSMGRKEFLGSFNEKQIEKVNQKLLQMAMRAINKIPLIKNLILKTLAKLNLYYPIKVIAQKK
ncbi:MAG: class I SAM-dependent methyltransferase [Sedimentisphaerales bacterium]|nr:class I SAM-dependent methyltransferase [Sedimentisphaerales bacterium]